MTFDLIVWPVDSSMSMEEAIAAADELHGSFPLGIGHDKRLDRFIAEMEKRYPGIRGRASDPAPCEFDVRRGHVFLGIPWSMVDELVGVVADAAWRTGLAVYDPQRATVGLPSPFADAPLSSRGVELHVAKADHAVAAIERGASRASSADDEDAMRAVSEELTAAGFHQVSPLGFEVTPELAAEVLADPARLPSSLQTPDHKARLIGDLSAPLVGTRHVAIAQLSGWDEDPDVAAALRPMLESDDVFEASRAAAGLVRQGDVTDLPAVVDLLHRMSPADGGTLESMLLVLPAALDLAKLGGPTAIDGLAIRARQWRGDPPAHRQPWQTDLYGAVDELLGSR